ncbi:MAG: phenylalanine--tRNA ligase subunit beta [Phycisphaerales bacterium]|nr:phenylalanine--tRNA ligase subunit beta [Phycisphaerales bacterium]
MNISVAWLNRYLQPANASPDEVERSLMDAGFPIESRETLEGGDVRLDVEITSNRGDCLSHVGLAREVAAKTGRSFAAPVTQLPNATGGPIAPLLSIENNQPSECPLFTARLIRGVKVGPSPAWLVKALESVGQRSINNVVDITNFITFELGHPCHVFDLKKLAGGKLVIRFARDNEALTTLDAKKRTLKSDELVVADAERAQSLAGVIGGADSEIDASSTDVVLEMATWDPVTIRRAARRLGIRTDASYRFERIVDPRMIDDAARRAAALIIEVAGGSLCEGVIAKGPALKPLTPIRLRPERCDSLLGVHTEVPEIARVLTSVGVVVEPIGRAGGELRCTAPAWRPDLSREVDLIEEVARLRGLSVIPIMDKLPVTIREPQRSERARRELSRVLTGLGFYETITFSFVSRPDAKSFVPPGLSSIEVDDERRKAEPVVRPSVIPSLLSCRRGNQDAKAVAPGSARLFEVSAVFAQEGDGSTRQTVEHRNVALLLDVPSGGGKPGVAEKQEGVRLVRGAIEAMVRAMRGHGADLTFTPGVAPFASMDSGACAGVSLDGKPLGYFGLVAPATLAQFGLDHPVVAAEIGLDPLVAAFPPKASVTTRPAFPAIDRDLSVIVDEKVTWASLQSIVQSQSMKWRERLEFVGAYRGKQIGQGKKSVTFRLYFRDAERTLRREEVDPEIDALVTRLKKDCGAEVRTA